MTQIKGDASLGWAITPRCCDYMGLIAAAQGTVLSPPPTMVSLFTRRWRSPIVCCGPGFMLPV